MKITVIIHRPHHRHARSLLSGREFPALPGCYTQGDTVEELMRNIPEAVDCHLGPDNVDRPEKLPTDVDVKVVEVELSPNVPVATVTPEFSPTATPAAPA